MLKLSAGETQWDVSFKIFFLSFNLPVSSPESQQGSSAADGEVGNGDIVEFSSNNLLFFVFFYRWIVSFFQCNFNILSIDCSTSDVKPPKHVFGKNEFQYLLLDFHAIKIVNKLINNSHCISFL